MSGEDTKGFITLQSQTCWCEQSSLLSVLGGRAKGRKGKTLQGVFLERRVPALITGGCYCQTTNPKCTQIGRVPWDLCGNVAR